MSLYNFLMGEDQNARRYLEMIGEEVDGFGRYRDAHLNSDGTKIIVYTRCGGPNRIDYPWVFQHMRLNHYYVRDWDDEFDNTYCYIEFRVPKKYLKETKKLSTGKEPLSVHEKFEKEMEEMKIPGSDAEKRALELAKKIQSDIDSMPNGGVIRL